MCYLSSQVGCLCAQKSCPKFCLTEPIEPPRPALAAALPSLSNLLATCCWCQLLPRELLWANEPMSQWANGAPQPDLSPPVNTAPNPAASHPLAPTQQLHALCFKPSSPASYAPNPAPLHPYPLICLLSFQNFRPNTRCRPPSARCIDLPSSNNSDPNHITPLHKPTSIYLPCNTSIHTFHCHYTFLILQPLPKIKDSGASFS